MSGGIPVRLNGEEPSFLISPPGEQNDNSEVKAVCVGTSIRVSFQTGKQQRQNVIGVLDIVRNRMSKKGGLLGLNERLRLQSNIETAIPDSEVVGPESLTLF